MPFVALFFTAAMTPFPLRNQLDNYFDNRLIIKVVYKEQMPNICWFQLLKCELNHCKLNISDKKKHFKDFGLTFSLRFDIFRLKD